MNQIDVLKKYIRPLICLNLRFYGKMDESILDKNRKDLDQQIELLNYWNNLWETDQFHFIGKVNWTNKNKETDLNDSIQIPEYNENYTQNMNIEEQIKTIAENIYVKEKEVARRNHFGHVRGDFEHFFEDVSCIKSCLDHNYIILGLYYPKDKDGNYKDYFSAFILNSINEHLQIKSILYKNMNSLDLLISNELTIDYLKDNFKLIHNIKEFFDTLTPDVKLSFTSEQKQKLFIKIFNEIIFNKIDTSNLQMIFLRRLLKSYPYDKTKENTQNDIQITMDLSKWELFNLLLIHQFKMITKKQNISDSQYFEFYVRSHVYQIVNNYQNSLLSNPGEASKLDISNENIQNILNKEKQKLLLNATFSWSDFLKSIKLPTYLSNDYNNNIYLKEKLSKIEQGLNIKINKEIYNIILNTSLYIGENISNGSRSIPTYLDDELGHSYWKKNPFYKFANRPIVETNIYHLISVCMVFKKQNKQKLFIKHTAPKTGVWAIDISHINTYNEMKILIEKQLGNLLYIENANNGNAFIVQPYINFRNEQRFFIVNSEIIKAVPVRRKDCVFDDTSEIIIPYTCFKHDNYERVKDIEKTKKYNEFVLKMMADNKNYKYNIVIDIGEDENGNIYPIEINSLINAGRYGYNGQSLYPALVENNIDYEKLLLAIMKNNKLESISDIDNREEDEFLIKLTS